MTLRTSFTATLFFLVIVLAVVGNEVSALA